LNLTKLTYQEAIRKYDGRTRYIQHFCAGAAPYTAIRNGSSWPVAKAKSFEAPIYLVRVCGVNNTVVKTLGTDQTPAQAVALALGYDPQGNESVRISRFAKWSRKTNQDERRNEEGQRLVAARVGSTSWGTLADWNCTPKQTLAGALPAQLENLQSSGQPQPDIKPIKI